MTEDGAIARYGIPPSATDVAAIRALAAEETNDVAQISVTSRFYAFIA